MLHIRTWRQLQGITVESIVENFYLNNGGRIVQKRSGLAILQKDFQYIRDKW